MPRIMYLFVTQSLFGFALGAAFVALILWFDVAGLGYLVTHSDGGLLAVALLWMLNGSVFAAAQFGIALMRLRPDDEEDRGSRASRRPEPVEVRSRIPHTGVARRSRG